MHKYLLPKEYLSASSIGTLMRCPRQFEFRYVKGLVCPPGKAMLVGTAVHACFETYYRDVINDPVGGRLPASAMLELGAEEVDRAVQSDPTGSLASEKDDIRSVVQAVASNYIEHVAHTVYPISVERKVVYTSRCGVPLLAYLDLERHVTEDDKWTRDSEAPTPTSPQDRVSVIADYKITKSKWTMPKLVNSLQFNLYTLATGVGNIEVHNLTKPTSTVVKKPKIQPAEDSGMIDVTSQIRILRNQFDATEVDHFEDVIQAAAETITSGVFSPCLPDSWCCNEAWCGYYSLCRGKHKAGLSKAVFLTEADIQSNRSADDVLESL